jgi:hypothetical protein
MVSTLMLGVPWHECVEQKSCPSFSLRMACYENMEFALRGENQGSKGDDACST